MDPCWKNLPLDLVYKICNMLPHVNRVNPLLLDDIKNQAHIFDKYYYNVLSMFGIDNAWGVIYDDLKYIAHVPDIYGEDDDLEHVVCMMWRSATQEQRMQITLHY